MFKNKYKNTAAALVLTGLTLSFSICSANVIAGYLDVTSMGSANSVSLADAKADGYNMVILAFASIDGVQIAPFKGTGDLLAKKIAEAKANNMKTLISVGGQVNTFNPGSLSTDEINTLAKNIAAFVKTEGLDGIDFDIEADNITEELITKITTAIRQQDNNILITAAPQISNGHLVTTGNNNYYDAAIRNNVFDYLFLQEYNSAGENDPNFISSSFALVKSMLPADSKTKIVVGEPTDYVGGGSLTIYHPDSNTTLTTPEVTKKMLAPLASIHLDSRFSGVMGWSLNTDYDAKDFGDASHIPGTYAYGLKDCVMDGQCATPPKPKPDLPNFNLQVSNTNDSTGMIVRVLPETGGDPFTSDYIAPGKNRTYNRSSSGVTHIDNIENQNNLTVAWSTYSGGPTGTCPEKFNLDKNTNVMINPVTKDCAIKAL